MSGGGGDDDGEIKKIVDDDRWAGSSSLSVLVLRVKNSHVETHIARGGRQDMEKRNEPVKKNWCGVVFVRN